jgi:general secretion pathway protein A
MLLNYETNEFKLLQLVILAQTELLSRLKRVHNFMDRIAMKYALNPLDETEVKKMIHFRLVQAGYKNQNHLFNDGAVKLIMHHTQGYPRKVSMLCHDAIESLVMKDKDTVDEQIILELLQTKNRI